MVNAYLPLKCPYSIPHYDVFKMLRHVLLVSYCYNIKDKFCLKISDSYLYKNKSYGCVKNGMLCSDNAKIKNTRIAISMILYN